MIRGYSRTARIYRSRHGVILGVCRGLAEHLDVRVLWIRVIAVVLLISTGFWPFAGLYLLAALVLKPEPVLPLRDGGRTGLLQQLRSLAYHGAESPAPHLRSTRPSHSQRMENMVTNREYDWERRLRTGERD